MKKRFLSAVILAAAAILIGGCEQQGSDDGGGGYFSGTVTDEQVYAAGDPVPTEGPYALDMLAFSEGAFMTTAVEVAATFADGKLSFTLPDTIKPKSMSAYFDELFEGLTVNPPNSEVFLVAGFAVYGGEGELIGRLLYSTAGASIYFLYSPRPFTVTGVDSNNDVNFEIAAGTGWNTLLDDKKNDSYTTGAPPADAKWRFYASR